MEAGRTTAIRRHARGRRTNFQLCVGQVPRTQYEQVNSTQQTRGVLRASQPAAATCLQQICAHGHFPARDIDPEPLADAAEREVADRCERSQVRFALPVDPLLFLRPACDANQSCVTCHGPAARSASGAGLLTCSNALCIYTWPQNEAKGTYAWQTSDHVELGHAPNQHTLALCQSPPFSLPLKASHVLMPCPEHDTGPCFCGRNKRRLRQPGPCTSQQQQQPARVSHLRPAAICAVVHALEIRLCKPILDI
jgi:hypothetical protein